MFKRPKSDDEIKNREALGVIRASRFVRKHAHSQKPITISVVRQIHEKIFENAWPEIAGENRIENIKIKHSKHLPPHWKDVSTMMDVLNAELLARSEKIHDCEGIIQGSEDINDEIIDCIDKVINCAAWLHHQITYIHPFREGNGRTARLAANLILERNGLVGISVKIENENKTHYCKALRQADLQNDLEPLKDLIYEGLSERYSGASLKYYKFVNRKNKL